MRNEAVSFPVPDMMDERKSISSKMQTPRVAFQFHYESMMATGGFLSLFDANQGSQHQLSQTDINTLSLVVTYIYLRLRDPSLDLTHFARKAAAMTAAHSRRTAIHIARMCIFETRLAASRRRLASFVSKPAALDETLPRPPPLATPTPPPARSSPARAA